MTRLVRLLAAALVLSACGGGNGGGQQQEEAPPPPPPPSSASFEISSTQVNESENPLVRVSLSLSRAVDGEVSAPVTIAGSATRDYDYVVNPADNDNSSSGDQLTIPSGQTSASFEIDIYRDFEDEGDETITLELGTLSGDAEIAGEPSLTLDIVDGGSASTLKGLEDFEFEGEDVTLLPAYFQVGDAGVDFGLIVINGSEETIRLTVQYSADFDFEQSVQTLEAVDIESGSQFDLLDFASTIRPYTIPLSDLSTDTAYYIRAYFGDPPASFEDAQQSELVGYLGFATNSQGLVRTRCQAPTRVPDPSGDDPLFSEQWHLVNTGQAAYSDSGGLAGADLAMGQAIEDGASGAGVKLAIVDTGLEICHPDLAANVLPGESYNFGFELTPGALKDDPFNIEILGDHGTSVAGVAAAVADNGLGGRGVAPKVGLVGFNLGLSLSDDPERDTLRSLGGSNSDPDSTSVDIFNMSWGTAIPSTNPTPDFVNLLKLGTSTLRDGLGALYIKAAGNAFGECLREHPLHQELGCIGSNTDPDQNLPYTIAVGGFNANDIKSSYSSAGANLWVVAPSGEDGVDAPAIITTDQVGAAVGYNLDPYNRLAGDGDYLSAFGGTSSAAPATAGAIALLLEAEPALTWRDVKHVLAVSARKIDPDRKASRVAFNGHPYIAQHAWVTNAAGYHFHNWYGFGAIGIDAALERAALHTPASLGAFVESAWFEYSPESDEEIAIPDAHGAGVTRSLEIAGLPSTANIEAVVLEFSASHFFPIELGIGLTSPSGTPSILNAPFNAILDGHTNIQSWQLLSNAFYGESPNGEWTLNVVDLAAEDEGTIDQWRLKIYYGQHGNGAAQP